MDKCKICEGNEYGYQEPIYTMYGEFHIEIIQDEAHINDDYGHEDTIKINYCPMCGRKL